MITISCAPVCVRIKGVWSGWQRIFDNLVESERVVSHELWWRISSADADSCTLPLDGTRSVHTTRGIDTWLTATPDILDSVNHGLRSVQEIAWFSAAQVTTGREIALTSVKLLRRKRLGPSAAGKRRKAALTRFWLADCGVDANRPDR